MIRGLRYLFWRGKPPKEMDHTQVFRLSLRLKSELADEARRRFKNDPDGVVFNLSPPASGGRAPSRMKRREPFRAGKLRRARAYELNLFYVSGTA